MFLETLIIWSKYSFDGRSLSQWSEYFFALCAAPSVKAFVHPYAIRWVCQTKVDAFIWHLLQDGHAIAVVQLHGAAPFLLAFWCRLQGSNLRTSGYEPDALAD